MSTYLQNCSDNINNYELCLKHGKAGFTYTTPKTGDLVYLIRRGNDNKWYCGARGILGSETQSKPWENSDLYKLAFDIKWEKCQEFSITEGFQEIYPNYGLALQGPKNLEEFLDKEVEVKAFFDKYFNDEKEFEKVAVNELPMTNKRMVAHVHQYIASVGFQYQYEEIANFYLALKAKPFVILAGISGTGKTQLPRIFAEAIGMSKEQVIQMPVRPDWTDGSDLLGYTSLDGQFKPKDLTLAIQKAHNNPDKPYFFILDEMNLARVEHYFSDFLSVIETRERKNGKITTDSILRDEVIRNAANASEFKAMGWPQNLYLIGTVNMDETTHAFSKKVLDRANSIEMNEVDLGWIKRSSTSEKPLEDIDNSFFVTEFIRSLDLSDEDKNSIQSEMELLKQVNFILQKADLHFAYRVRDEVAFYLVLNNKYKLIENKAAMYFQLVQKVLPRIHGSSERVQTVLVELLNLFEGNNFRSTNFEYAQIEGKIDINNLEYKRSSKKILFMLKRFDDDRFTSFWL